MSIPKHILQISIGDVYTSSIPKDLIKKNLLKYNTDYSYTLYTEQECIQFLKTYFPHYISLYNKIQRPQYKSDLIRYLYLYVHGGWYIDIDLLVTRPLIDKPNIDLVVVEGANTDPSKGVYEMANGCIGTSSKNQLFLELVEFMIRDPNPYDYGLNVKRFYAHIHTKNYSKILFLKEKQHNQAYSIFENDELFCLSNGNGYPHLNPIEL